ncbi:helix-turn-helix transcriptional regulator [Amycolatopsis minnesotensis]|uniref:HTH luxR-type domain-containing protein n=1 Tax=Amycolatopsis minnesotensis TaxID=337894 RepID=A0ABP5C7A1_9PSEU
MLADRGGQLAFLTARAVASGAGNGQVVLVRGAVSHGKTALLRKFAEQLADSGTQFLSASCARAESMLPMGVLSQLFHSAALPADLRARVGELLDQGAAMASPHGIGSGAIEPAATQVFTGLLRVLWELSGRHPLLLGIDDVEHADAASLHCLLFLARRLRSARVLIVLTETPRMPARTSPPHAEFGQLPNAHLLRLAPLGRPSVEALVGSGAPDPYAVTGGNPGLVRALLDDLAGQEEAPGRGYRRAVTGCLDRCESVLSEVACGLAVLGPQAAATTIGGLLGMDPDVVADALELLEDAGLTEGQALRHPAVGQAVLDELPPRRREALHRRAARLLQDRGEPAMPVARHLVGASGSPEDWSVDVLVEAAAHALVTDQVAFAVDCLNLALRQVPDGRRRVSVRAKLARAEWQLNPSAALRHLEPVLDGMRSGLLDPRDAIATVRQLLWHGRVDDAVEALNWVRGADAGGEVATELRDAELWMTSLYPSLGTRQHVSPEPPVDRPGPRPFRADPWLRSAAVLAGTLSREERQSGPAGAEQFLGRTQLSHTTPWSEEPAVLALLALVHTDRVPSAERSCARLAEESAARGAPTWQAAFAAVGALIALRQGDLDTAAERARLAMKLMSPKAWGVGVGFPLGSLILAATLAGRYDEAGSMVTQPVPDALFQSRHGLHYLHARGQYYLATGRYHAALADFLACGELQRSWGLDLPGLVPWRTSAAETWLRLQNRDRAKRLVFDQLARTGAGGGRPRALALRVLATAGQVDRRPQLLTEAVDILEGCGDRFELARALTDLGRVYHALGERRRARMTVRRAWHLAKACGAGPLCRELLPELGATDLTVPSSANSEGIGSLTGAERRVASLAVAGYTNREIAAKLFITSSTVEQHLTRVFRKLHVKYRRDLPTDLHADLATSA